MSMHKQASLLYKKRKRRKNNLLLNELVYTGERKGRTTATLVQYNPDKMNIKNIDSPETLHSLLNENQVNWLNIVGISDAEYIARLGVSLRIHQLDIQDILLTQHIAKIEVYADRVVFLVNSYSVSGNNELQQEHIGLVLGNNFVASFQESESPLFENIKLAVKLNTAMIRNKGNDYLFITLVNSILNANIETLAYLEDRVSELEDELSEGSPADNFVKRLQENRHWCILLKKSLFPLKDDFKTLIINENQLIRPENIIYLNDLQDRLTFILQTADSFHESCAAVMEWYLSNNDLRMNEIMKRLTVVTTIFIPLTFMVGVWGMNFKIMPELEWQYGYLMAWASFIIITLAVWWYIRKKKWN